MSESPRYTRIADLSFDADAATYRSVPGRGGAHDTRRIDVSSGAQVAVDFYLLRPQSRGAMLREHMGRYILMRGVPLFWPVPAEALGDDILVVVQNRDTIPSDVHVMDFWRV